MTDPPAVRGTVSAGCAVNPSEDPQKVRLALSNVLPGVDFRRDGSGMRGSSPDLRCLARLCDEVRNRRIQASLRRQIRANAGDGSFWFYLNKQAAFVGVAALCEHDDESPLGAIRLSVTSGRIAEVAAWLVGVEAGDVLAGRPRARDGAAAAGRRGPPAPRA